MPRIVYLVVYNSPLFPAHWSLWIPSKDQSTLGKRIHVEGNSLSGFTISFERNYNIKEDGRTYQLFALGKILDEFVDDAQGDGSPSSDQTPQDRLERVAMSIPPPGKSLSLVSDIGPKRRVEVKNCQTWLKDVVAQLAQEEVLGKEALATINAAPKN